MSSVWFGWVYYIVAATIGTLIAGRDGFFGASFGFLVAVALLIQRNTEKP